MGDRSSTPSTPSPIVPEETLDALVVVLDEIRLGRSHSRSDLVAHTGLSPHDRRASACAT